MPPQFVYTMKGLGKVYPPDSQVLKDIWLSFLPGAKIGVLGLNGAGKSTLLKIMAGVETNFVGEAFPGQGVSVGFLPAGAAAQSRQGRPRQRRRGRAPRSRRAARSLRRRQHEARRGHVARGDGQGPRRAVAAAGSHRRHQRLGPRLAARAGDGRAAPAAARCRRRRRCRAASAAAWRCAGCCCSRPTCCCSTSRPTTSTPSRWRGSSGSSRTTPAPSSRSRTIATSSTTSPAGSSSSIAATAFRTRATTPAGSSRSRAGCSRKRRPRASGSGRCSASSTGSACRRAPARPRARRA